MTGRLAALNTAFQRLADAREALIDAGALASARKGAPGDAYRAATKAIAIVYREILRLEAAQRRSAA